MPAIIMADIQKFHFIISWEGRGAISSSLSTCNKSDLLMSKFQQSRLWFTFGCRISITADNPIY